MATKNMNEEMNNRAEVTTVETKIAPPKKKRTISERTKKLNAIDFSFMIDYIQKNASEDKEWFISIAFDEKHSYKHLKARNAFVERYMPELAPKKKKSKWDILKEMNWVA